MHFGALRPQAEAQSPLPLQRGRRLVCRSQPPALKTTEEPEHKSLDKDKQEQLFFFT